MEFWDVVVFLLLVLELLQSALFIYTRLFTCIGIVNVINFQPGRQDYRMSRMCTAEKNIWNLLIIDTFLLYINIKLPQAAEILCTNQI